MIILLALGLCYKKTYFNYNIHSYVISTCLYMNVYTFVLFIGVIMVRCCAVEEGPQF
jgi:hypothetical protein